MHGWSHTWLRYVNTSSVTVHFTLDERVNFQQHISEMFHIPNALWFCVKMRYQSHLYDWYWANINIHLSVGLPGISILSQHYDKYFC